MTRPGRLRYIGQRRRPTLAGIHPPPEPKRPDRQRRDTGAAYPLDACVPGGVHQSRAAPAAGSPAIRAAALVLAVVLALVDSFAFIAMKHPNAARLSVYRAEDQGMHQRPSTRTRAEAVTNAAETMEDGAARARQSRVVMTLPINVELNRAEQVGRDRMAVSRF